MSELPASSTSCSKCGAALPSAATAGLCPRCLMAEAMAPTEAGAETSAARQTIPPAELAPHFPQLEILECLGRGGMGVVYKARQKTLNRFVALKLLAPERVCEAKFAERFTSEAQALAALNHPNIVTIYDFGQAGGFYYLLMEFVDGVNLRQLLRMRKFTPEEALAIVPPLCDALQFAHNRGIVHRDIKPENLLLDKDGRVKVADFGIAKMLGAADGGGGGTSAAPGNATQTAVGTPGYSSPEQKTDPQRVDSRADIYSLGVVFYEMLTGELPGQRLEPPSKKVHIDVRLDEVVLRALEQNPELRYQQASEVKTMVETIAQTPAPPESHHRPTPASTIPPTTPFGRIFQWGMTIFVMLVMLQLLLVYFGYPRENRAFHYVSLCFCIFMLVASAGLFLRAGRVPWNPAWGSRRLYRGMMVFGFVSFLAALVVDHFDLKTRFFSRSDYIGQGYFPKGDSIEISSVDRSSSRLVVKGHYNLVSQDQATLFLYVTSTNRGGPDRVQNDAQRMDISKGRGDFELAHSPAPGLPHLVMYGNGEGLADLYFGTQAEAAQEGKMNLQPRLAQVVAGPADTRLEGKVKYTSDQASVQDIVRSLAEQVGLRYDWQKSFAQTDPLCRQWVRNVAIEGKTCHEALEQVLKPVGLRYQVEEGVLVLSRQAKGTQPPQSGASSTSVPSGKGYVTNGPAPTGLAQPAAGPADTRLGIKVKYMSEQASVQDIVQSLAEQVGLRYDRQKSFAQTDPLCRQWVRNVAIEGKTCHEALEQILKPVGLRYQVEEGVLVLSRQATSEPPGKGYVTNGPAPTGFVPAQMLSAKEQRENFDFLCQAIDETYASFELKTIDWGQVRRRYEERLDPAANADQFYRLLFQLVNELKDTHSWLQNYHPAFPASGPELTVDLFEGKPFIVAVNADSEAAGLGVKPGSEVLEVDGLSVEDKLKQLRLGLRACSSERAFRREACRYLLAGERGTTVDLKLRLPDGHAQTFALRRMTGVSDPPRQTCSFDLKEQRFVQFGRHPSGLGYIRITSFDGHEVVPQEFDQALEALRTAPGLILDIRDNPGGYGQPHIVGRLLQRPTLCAISFIKNGPAHGALKRQDDILEPTGTWQYRGPIALLVNDVTGSAADLFACYLRSAKRVVTVGSTTHGNLSGVAAFAVLPCGLVVRISNGYICDAGGKPIEGNGNAPDVNVAPTISDFLAGRDPVLEKAVALVREKSQRN
ncbi:MAG: protein kinase domain-containing protein [Limisphaerales bacterium]